jgi:hypothetical protein
MFKKPNMANLALREASLPAWPALAFAAVLVAATNVALAQQGRPATPGSAAQVRFHNGRHAVTIPIDFDDGAVVVWVRVNNSPPLKFFFDTGAGISVLSAAQAAKLHLQSTDDLKVTGTGGTVNGTMARGVSLSVPGVTVLNQTVAVLSLDDFPCEARDIAGIIGYDFIKEFVVEIDYDAKVMRLRDPASHQNPRRGNSLPLTIARTPRVHAQIRIAGRDPVDGLFEIDTGHEGTLVINSPFVNRHQLLQSLGNRIPATGRGVGGVSMRVGARLVSLQMGQYTVASPVVALSLETEGALSATDNDGPIGNEILRRFKLILDYSRKRMWLEPNAHLTEPFASDMSGIEFDSGGDNCRVFKVTSIAENSPAAETGIQPGDEIVAIDGRAAGQFTSSEIYKLFMIEGAEHALVLRRANQSFTVKIKLRRLL